MKKPSYTKSLIALPFFFCPYFLFSQSDICAAPTSISSSTTCITGTSQLTGQTLSGKTQSSPNVASTCAGTPGADVWYSFVAQEAAPTISLSALGTGFQTAASKVFIQIFATCGGASLSCAASAGTAGVTTFSTTLASLTPGTTYLIRIYTLTVAPGGANWGYTICVTDPVPANDNCAGAIALNSGSTCTNTSGYVVGSTLTGGIPAPACGAPTYDVWYRFTAQTTNPTITISGNTNFTNPHIQLLSGACGGQANVSCSATGTLAATGLSIGTQYYVRVYSTAAVPTSSGLFNICITDPAPGNDDCAGAVTLASGTACTNVQGNVIASTLSSGILAPSCGTPTYDVWYKFVAQSSAENITLSAPAAPASWTGYTNHGIQLLQGSCGSLSTVACVTGNTLNATSLTFGTTYYVRVYSTSAVPTANGAFNICVQNVAAANGTCATATVLTPGPSCTTIAGDLSLANQTNPTNSCGNYYDVWYQFTPPAGYSFAYITVTPTGSPNGLTPANTFIETFKNNCGALNNNSMGCNSIAPVKNVAIISGVPNYFRVYTTANPNVAGTSYQFDICVTLVPSVNGLGSRMAEVFQQSILSQPGVLQYPWEVTYGPDGFLWLTEARGYKAYRVDINTGAKSTILDISNGSATPELTATEHTNYNVEFTSAQNPWPQGGFAGLAIHPQFNSGKPYVYISYVKRYVSTAAGNAGVFFTNYLVRFTYNSGTGKLTSPVTICDTLPGSSDHNSQRVAIVPVGGTYYLFYAQGDMGAGQFGNAMRTNKAQSMNSYEGKILRFNLEPDADAGALDKWIPNSNPFNVTLGVQSAVWAMGIRNNQGFVYDTSTHLLYGSSHGPFSDDEINIIESGKNYGHPYVEGFAGDHNYDGITAGAAPNMNPPAPSSCPTIGNEVTNAAGIANYKDPLFSAYNTPTPVSPTNFTTMSQLWNATAGANNIWPSEGWSGLDLYSSSLIPGWKRSLVASGLKWGRLIRLKLGPTGTTTLPSNLANWNNTGDTVTYLQSTNRYRDLTFAPNGRDIYIVMDNNSATSGPGIGNPTTAGCPGCLMKYTFLGYNVNTGSANRSFIPTSITVAQGKNNTCDSVNTVTINTANGNNNLWVPLTDTSSNIVAEIYAMGQNLGNVTAKVYHNANAIRSKSGNQYLDRNITITPQTQPGANVKVRLYITKAEYDALQASAGSGISNPTDVKLFKNNDPCGSNMTANVNTVPMDFTTEAFGPNAYVLQGTISSFSTFYFGSNALITLPLNLLNFSGSLQADNTALLKWETANETNTSEFIVERSVDGRTFQSIGTVAAVGNSGANNKYSFIDYNAARQSSTVLYYHLKMVDNDGSYTFSDIVTITLPVTTSRVSLYPNPAAHEVNVNITAAIDGKIKWQIIDNAGRILAHNSIVAKRGNNNVVINLNRLSSGTYFLIVSGAEIDQKIKLEKL
jgi:glucose/arabinose dehydrogenase